MCISICILFRQTSETEYANEVSRTIFLIRSENYSCTYQSMYAISYLNIDKENYDHIVCIYKINS